MTIQNLFLIFIGGGAGSVLRFFFSWMLKSQTMVRLPLATLTANILSVIILSLVYASVQQKENTNENLRFLILIGFCGGLSTFSTFSYETVEMFRRGETLWAWGNIIFNNALCIALIFLLLRKTQS